MINKLKIINEKLKITLSRGFTLIELLVVVTLIAILAVAVLATINPIEQRNKGRDTSVKQTAGEYISAQERLYATYGCFSHNMTAGAACTATVIGSCAPAATDLAATAINLVACNNSLQASGEVKPSLITRLGVDPYDDIFISVTGGIMHAAFTPKSKSFLSKSTWTQTCSASVGGTYYCIPDTLE